MASIRIFVKSRILCKFWWRSKVSNYDKMKFSYRKLFQSLKKIDGFNEGFTEPKILEEEIKALAEKSLK